MRIPETFSSASAVSSPIRCWTSCWAGREIWLYLVAARITNGAGISATSASSGLIAIITAAARVIVSRFWVMKISP
jgi:hypothetical protein